MTGAATPSHTSVRWNLPDWRDETAYAYIDELTPARARWECLRRFGAYRTKWTLFGATVGGFGLPTLLDPRLRGDDLPSTFSFIEEGWRGTVIDNRWDATAEHLDLLYENGVVLVRVDLYRPIGPQLDTAGKALAKLREAEIRQIPETESTETGFGKLLRKMGPDFPDRVVERVRERPKLIGHLRAADAITEGCLWREVAAEVWGMLSESIPSIDTTSRTKGEKGKFFIGIGLSFEFPRDRLSLKFGEVMPSKLSTDRPKEKQKTSKKDKPLKASSNSNGRTVASIDCARSSDALIEDVQVEKRGTELAEELSSPDKAALCSPTDDSVSPTGRRNRKRKNLKKNSSLKDSPNSSGRSVDSANDSN